MIFGILDCKNKTIYGINRKTNTPLVIFTSHTGDKYLIPSKLKYTNKNYYCVIKEVKKDDKYRFPIGQLLYTIGDISDEKANYEYILHCNNLNHKEPKLSKNKMKKLKKSDGNIWKIIHKEKMRTYQDYTHIHTVTVDPKGSKDFDDAISIRDDYIGIHIADVSFWLEELGILPEFFSTVYLPHRKINMIPSILADNICSLREGVDRLALTLWYKDDDDYYIEDTIINVDKNYTYEEYSINESLYDISKGVGIKYNMDVKNWDTHKMIEAYMILANNKIAEYLKEHKKPLFRIHKEKHHQYNLNEIKNEKFKEFMKIYLSNAAEYSLTEGTHYGLQLDLYTHFTSPIRRMADVYVHCLIKSLQTKIDLDKCNQDIKKTRRLKRDIERYQMIHKLKETKTTNGYVINFYNDKVTCYFPDFDFCDKFLIVPHKLKDNQEIKEKQRNKIKKLGVLEVTIGKVGNKLIYNF